MNHNVYLPDDVSERAKEAGLNLSGMLRATIVEELERRTAVSEALAETQEYSIEGLEDDEGRPYTGLVVGKEIAISERTGSVVYLTDDERVIIHDAEDRKIHQFEDHEDLLTAARESRDGEMYADAARALGLTPVINL